MVQRVDAICLTGGSAYGLAAADGGGLRITEGTFVTMAVEAAQRDPRAYPGGDVFDITATRDAPTGRPFAFRNV